MFMKAGYKVQTPENIERTLKRKSLINWAIFLVILGLVTVGILEIITSTPK